MNKLISWFYNLKNNIYVKHMKRKYPDWEDDEYNCGNLKFIWGIKSYDDLSSAMPNFYTMNDIDITYNRKSGLYSLGVETAYGFDGGQKQGEVKYLDYLLSEFTKFMMDNNYRIDEPYMLLMAQPCTNCFAESIPELYMHFRIFVEGYKAVYGGKNNA